MIVKEGPIQSTYATRELATMAKTWHPTVIRRLTAF